MAGLVPAIHVLFPVLKKDVDARDKRGHDEDTGYRLTPLLRAAFGLRPGALFLPHLLPAGIDLGRGRGLLGAARREPPADEVRAAKAEAKPDHRRDQQAVETLHAYVPCCRRRVSAEPAPRRLHSIWITGC